MNSNIQISNDGTLYLRKSMVESFNFCPMQFRKTYIEGNETQESYIMQIGTRFHEFAYWFFDVCESIPVDQWTELVPSAFTSEEQDMAYWFLLTEQERYNNCTTRFMPIQREIKLQDDELCISGTVDRIDQLDGDDLVIVEYKTGKSYNEESIVRQLSFYKILWDNTIKKGDIKYMKYINPRTQVLKWITVDPKMTDKVLMNINKIRKAMEEDIFPRRCSPVKHIICNLCNFDECGLYGR